MDYLEQSFSVKFEYKVCFTRSLFDVNNRVLADFFAGRPGAHRKIFFVIDGGVTDAHNGLEKAIEAYFKQYQEVELIAEILVVPGGETAKNNTALFDQIVEMVDRHAIDRHSYIAAIGGGAVLDLVGYAAAVSHRGIKHIRIPTTVLSQNDSGIGVKNGINYKGKKNFLGTFAPPVAVFNDADFLTSLSDRDYRSGISEAIKVALIKDANFFRWIEDHAAELAVRHVESMAYLIRHCAKLHMQHIAGDDPFETGSARPLDFGHWSAHKLEQLSGFQVLHGEAVAMGIALDSTYSYLKGLLSEEDLIRVLNVLCVLSFDISNPLIRIDHPQAPVLQGLAEFREHLGGVLTITLLNSLGTGIEVHEMDIDLLVRASDYVVGFTTRQSAVQSCH